jgi:hypothetical protein
VIAELAEVMRAEVRQLVMFPITPDVLHRIEFRGVGRQVVQRQAAPLAGDKLPDPTALSTYRWATFRVLGHFLNDSDWSAAARFSAVERQQDSSGVPTAS